MEVLEVLPVHGIKALQIRPKLRFKQGLDR